MAYGMQLFNSSGRTIYNTDQSNSNYYFSGNPTSTNGYGVNPSFSYASTNILLARPQDAEDGAIFFSGSINDANYYLGGRTSYEQTFGAANGVKYIYGKSQSANITAATSGYGMEIYDTNGSTVLFTSETGQNFEILYVGTMNSTYNFTFNKPAGYNFDDIYVTAGSFSLIYAYDPGYPGLGIPPTHSVNGSWAWFDDSAETITFRQGNTVGVTQVYAAGTSGTGQSGMSQDFLIIGKLG